MDMRHPNGFAEVTAKDSIRVERLLPGPIDRLWQYITDPAKRARWLAGGDMDLTPGGTVELVFRNSEIVAGDRPPARFAELAKEMRMTGRILACDPPHLLSFTWGQSSNVTFTLTEKGSEVLLVVEHRALPSRGDMVMVSGGWHAHLAVLADRLADREPEGFWANFTELEAQYDKRIPRD